ncbi:site-specific DNA methylase [Neoasaia chiangmaiensis NBRC 101099]|uniref:DNA (cytosine-5-)-methyltransferase n=1 Tax=Neoasaia chiangmaiensis TaxID=320497 RepID=A0A1U9KQY8_9PROT|nr:DNA cytosine methyltransferase [Neoasaia chiangmaiensis]AQS88238.1 hypothetical protein A0U93_10145 [Neoasaia chiangmaiensis]GBR39762.1 site-specific DNA methylase [Neoasaia chiangmaiensis NBRC 101099]GEN14729.1 hypothetical protein NCH01_11600 [Neoasaia chiangmaiensis]
MKHVSTQWALDAEITVVLFAGLGGACEGLEDAGCPVHVACNHDPVAIAAHAANHPHTRHVTGDIFDVDPLEATGGRAVNVLWASPDCRDHSVAKGGAPRSARVRSLPWQVCRWVGKVRPRIVMMENVREIRGWGPLIAKRDRTTGRVVKLDGTVAARGERVPRHLQQLVRDKRRTGKSFRAFVRHLRQLGGEYEDRDLCCADFGVPTTRRRWFAVVRYDALPIAWPQRTHAPRDRAKSERLRPWVGAHTIIDWSIPMRSIFNRPRPLRPNTERRIAHGLRRYILENPRPFIMPITHTGAPRAYDTTEPLPTITGAHRGELSVVSAWMAQHNFTVDQGVVGTDLNDPLSTLTSRGTQQQLTAATLAHLRGTSQSADIEDPLPTVTSGGRHIACVGAFLTKYYGQGSQHQDAREPLHALTTLARFGVVGVEIGSASYAITDITMRMLDVREAAAAHELRLPTWVNIGGEIRPLTKTEGMRLVGNSVPKRMPSWLAGDVP